VLFLVGPQLLRHLSGGMLSRVLTYGFYAVEVFLVLLGVYWYFRVSGGAYASAAIRAEEAIKTIQNAFAQGSGRECGEAAARLLAGAYYSDGPGISGTFDREAARQQLGPALPFVISVEKFLIWKNKGDPVFTLPAAKEGPPESSRPRS
jgi:hypothetical protein